MSGNNDYPYRPGARFKIANPNDQIQSPYDLDSNLLTDLKQRGIKPVKVYRLNLGVAGSIYIDEPGYHFCIYGDDNGIGGTSVPAVNTTAQVNAWINGQCNDGSAPFPAKHARGFSGPFGQLFLEWPAQVSGVNPVYCNVVIFKSYEKPWIDGEAAT